MKNYELYFDKGQWYYVGVELRKINTVKPLPAALIYY